MPKSKQQKQKDREKRVAKKKLAEAAKRREIAQKAEGSTTGGPRNKKVMAEGVKQTKPQVQSAKPTVTHRRSGG